MKQRLKSTLICATRKSPLMAHAVAQVARLILGSFGHVQRLTRRRDYFIDSTTKVIGWKSIYFGPNCSIGRFTWINVNHRTNGISLEIGANSLIGQMNFINVGKKIRFGEYLMTASNCAFIGSDHIHDNPFHPYISTGTSCDASIDIGANCFFGYNAMVIGDATIGYGSIVGAGAVVRSDIPPMSMAVGNPARVIKRYSLSQGKWVRPEEAATESYPDEQAYVEILKKSHSNLILPLSVSASSLGDLS